MADRSFMPHGGTLEADLKTIAGQFTVGSTGAVSLVKGNGITSVTRLAVGTYQIQLDDGYARLFGASLAVRAPVTGGSVAATAVNPTTMYQITAVGTTNWQTAGLPTGVTAAVGVPFLCAATSTGTGTAKAIGVTGVTCVELAGDPNPLLNPASVAVGGTVIIQCLGATDASTTTLIPKDPASGSVVQIALTLRNSSLKGKGE